MNKKGTTLVELIVSIALISIVLVFMIKLLVDLNDTQTNNDYDKEDQIKRTEILRTIEKDISNKNITSVSSRPISNGFEVTFAYESDNPSKITIKTTTLEFRDSEEKTRKWTYSGGTFNNNATISESYGDSPENGKTYIGLVNIEVYTKNDKNKKGSNNPIDDITISYISKYTGP